MIVVLGLLGALVLIGALIGVLYVAGNRGRQANVANQVNAAKARQQTVPQEPARSQGRGDV